MLKSKKVDKEPKEVKDAKSRVGQLQNIIRNMERDRDTLVSNIDTLRNQLVDLNDKRIEYDTINSDLDVIVKRKQELLREVEESTIDLEINAKKRDKIAGEVFALRNETIVLMNSKRDLESEHKALEDRAKKLNYKLSNTQLSSTKSDDMRQEHNKLCSKLASIKSKIRNYQPQQVQLAQLNKKYEDSVKTLRDEQNQLKFDSKQLSDTIASLKQSYENLQQRYDKKQSVLDSIEKEDKRIKMERKLLEDQRVEIRDKRKQIDVDRNKADVIKAEILTLVKRFRQRVVTKNVKDYLKEVIKEDDGRTKQ